MNQLRDERGFTLVEIMVSLVVFAVIVVGALGVIAATNSGGLVAGLPTGFATTRTAKDYTVATVYLQGLNEHIATLPLSSLNCDGTAPPCTLTRSGAGTAPFGYATWPPSTQGFQLGTPALTVVLEVWNWNGTAYAPGGSTGDKLYMARSTMQWSFSGDNRAVTVDRYVPYHPWIPIPNP